MNSSSKEIYRFRGHKERGDSKPNMLNEKETTRCTNRHKILCATCASCGSFPSYGTVTLISYGTHEVCSESYRLSSHRGCSHRSFQLAVCAPPWRPVHPSYRRHRSAAECAGSARTDSPRFSLAWPELGRGR